jgi:Fe-S cluster biogenesis protein NfuA
MDDRQQFQQGLQQIEERVRALEEMPDPCVRTQVVELVQGIMQLHTVGLEQMLDIIRRTGAAGDDIVDRFTRDSLASGLLLLHDLHPVPFTERVAQAIEKVRPLLKSHGGDVELLGIDEGVVRLRLVGNCNGCPSSALTRRSAIEGALYELAPDMTSLEVVGEAEPSPTGGFVALENISLLTAAASPTEGDA